MKRTFAGLLVLVGCICLSPASNAQLGGGMSFFKKPNIGDIFHPVVGSGATYEQTGKDGTKSTIEMATMSREDFDGKEAYWMEVGHVEKKSGEMNYAKILISRPDFEMHKMIILMPGSANPIEMPMNQSAKTRERMQENLDKWHKVGTEPVVVPAGTFVCDHWAKDDGSEDIWASSKVSPMSLVKSSHKDGDTMILVKTTTNATEHITGTPQKFDPAIMRQQIMQQMQHKKDQ
ncbi:MAG: hypothetical protein JSS69_09980 [Acidobacteria bacterium]|nr:hypothetical protein [Acidobacteriota bacterium]MBS1866231.1 hypothetical protein [Acidobacteriota bacterium]